MLRDSFSHDRDEPRFLAEQHGISAADRNTYRTAADDGRKLDRDRTHAVSREIGGNGIAELSYTVDLLEQLVKAHRHGVAVLRRQPLHQPANFGIGSVGQED